MLADVSSNALLAAQRVRTLSDLRKQQALCMTFSPVTFDALAGASKQQVGPAEVCGCGSVARHSCRRFCCPFRH
jgi:hypothetical protein